MGIRYNGYTGQWESDNTGKSYGSSTAGKENALRADAQPSSRLSIREKQAATKARMRASTAAQKQKQLEAKRYADAKKAAETAAVRRRQAEERARDDREKAIAEQRRQYDDKMKMYQSQQAAMIKANQEAQAFAQSQVTAFQQSQQALMQPVTAAPTTGADGEPTAVEALQAQLLAQLSGQQNGAEASAAFYNSQAPELENKLYQSMASRGLGGQDFGNALAQALPQLQTQASLYGSQENRAGINNILSQYGALGSQQQAQNSLAQQNQQFNAGLNNQQYEFGQNMLFNQQQSTMQNLLAQQGLNNQLFGGLF